MSPKTFVIDRPLERSSLLDDPSSASLKDIPLLWHSSVPTSTLLSDAYMLAEPDIDFENDPETLIAGHTYDVESGTFIQTHIKDLSEEHRMQIAFELLDSILERTDDPDASYDELLDRAEALRFLAIQSFQGTYFHPAKVESTEQDHLEGIYAQLNEAKKVTRRIRAEVTQLLANTDGVNQQAELDALLGRALEASADIESWHSKLRDMTNRTSAQELRKRRELGARAANQAIQADLYPYAPMATKPNALSSKRALIDH